MGFPVAEADSAPDMLEFALFAGVVSVAWPSGGMGEELLEDGVGDAARGSNAPTFVFLSSAVLLLRIMLLDGSRGLFSMLPSIVSRATNAARAEPDTR
jgi:hypothetical protein